MKPIAWKEKIATLWESCLFFFYPPKCASCGKVGYEGHCPECEEEMKRLFKPERFLAYGGNGHADGMIALFPYHKWIVKQPLLDWKHENYTDLPMLFTPYLKRAVKQRIFPEKIHAVSYLPRRSSVRKKLGFDQAEQIALLVAKELSLPMVPLLQRTRRSKPQHAVKRKQREGNVRDVFEATRELAGETVLLVDDIVTTGATAREGARILKKAGAMKVFIFAIAH